MMTNEQYLLIKLAEEASELAQIALKTAQFGAYEQYEKSDKNNIGRVNAEFNDLLGVAALINDECDFKIDADPVEIEKKMNKVNYYRHYSADLGMVDNKDV